MRPNMLQSPVRLKTRISRGDLERLVDDAILKILCLCDAIDLLRVGQTCKYLRILAADREVWHAVLLRLPLEFTPSIVPNQKREKADFRDLALRAIRGYRNWTSENPKPIWQLPLSIQHSDRRLSDLRLLPGGEFLLYFVDNTLYCFDVKRNMYILERKNDFSELLQSTYQLHSDGETIRIAVIGCVKAEATMSIRLELIELHVETRRCELITEMNTEWSNLCSAAGGDYVMLRGPSLSGMHIMIPYLVGKYDENPSRGAMIFDCAHRSVILLSLQNCSTTSMDHESPVVSISNNHLLYMTGCGSQAPSIHSVPLAEFEGCWRSPDDVTKWINYDIQPGHEDACHLFRLTTPCPPSRFHLSVHSSTWLDLEKARLSNPSIISLSLVAINIVWVDDSMHPQDAELQSAIKHFQLQFAEVSPALNETISHAAPGSRTLGMFFNSDFASMSEYIGQPSIRTMANDLPSRSGRLVTRIWTNELQDKPQLRAIALRMNAPHTGALKHLDGTIVRHFAMDYYTSVVLFSSALREYGTLESAPDTKFVVEGYD